MPPGLKVTSALILYLTDESEGVDPEMKGKEPQKQEENDSDKDNMSEENDQIPANEFEPTEPNPEDDTENEDDEHLDDETKRKYKARKKALRPEEKFALFIQKEQYSWRSENKTFIDKGGRRIVFEDGLFPWVQYDNSGNVGQRFRIEEGSLEKGLIVPAAVWEYMKHNPESCILVVSDKAIITWIQMG